MTTKKTASKKPAAAAVKTPAAPAAPAASGPLPYLLEENHDLPLCRVQITVRTGAASDVVPPGAPPPPGLAEGRGVMGACNFATELMRRGAGGKTRAQLDERIDDLGASLHVWCWHDQVLFEVVALKDKLDEACAVLGDVLLRPDFPDTEAERLRRELHGNLDEMRDDDNSLAHRFYSREFYGDHPYGRPVAGTAESTDALSIPLARAWHKHYLTRGNIICGAAGDLTGKELESLLERHFAGIPGGPSREQAVPDAPPPRGLRVVLVDKPERTQSQILLGQAAPHWRDPIWLPMYVATTALGGTFTARLMDEVRVKRGLSYGASARVTNGRGRRSLYAHVFPSAEQTAETLDLVLKVYREWAEGGLRPGEMSFIQSYLRKSHAFSVQTPEDRLSLRTRLLLCGMPEDHVVTFPQRVAAVTEDEIRHAMQSLTPGDLLVTLVATAKSVLPSLEKLPVLRDAKFQTVAFDSY